MEIYLPTFRLPSDRARRTVREIRPGPPRRPVKKYNLCFDFWAFFETFRISLLEINAFNREAMALTLFLHTYIQ